MRATRGTTLKSVLDSETHSLRVWIDDQKPAFRRFQVVHRHLMALDRTCWCPPGWLVELLLTDRAAVPVHAEITRQPLHLSGWRYKTAGFQYWGERHVSLDQDD